MRRRDGQTSSLTINSDKKNENKEVAFNDFLPSATAHEAIQHSIIAHDFTIIDLNAHSQNGAKASASSFDQGWRF
ncbi:Soluble inorganic pyrophosphatase 3 [Camellia lanceoleosa]|uniref:Soluble inorganic pyrophosphatase 3 n=1 Tax=Camellia lanceoleosa TaxID=1840588 RepID=A0ACC0FYV4_9ERIC|nr:Soluble inorganic pyrophosphatase 3 [Camellia lanceoleosa]